MNTVLLFVIILTLIIVMICIACGMQASRDNEIAESTNTMNQVPSYSANRLEEDRWSINNFSNRRQNNSNPPYPTSDITSMPMPTAVSSRLPSLTSIMRPMPMPSVSRTTYTSNNGRNMENSPLVISTIISPAVTSNAPNSEDSPPSYSEVMKAGLEK